MANKVIISVAITGGNVRVGLEESLSIGKGQLAKSNAEQVSKIRHIIEELGLEIAHQLKHVKSWHSRAATA